MSIKGGRQIVITPGTRVPLLDQPFVVDRVDIFALEGNSGAGDLAIVAVGDRTVSQASGSENGTPLYPQPPESITLHAIDMATIYIDARTANNGVRWLAEFSE